MSPMDEPRVHKPEYDPFLHMDRTACRSFLARDVRASEDWSAVTCRACLKKRPAAVSVVEPETR